MARVFIALGSNIDPHENMLRAVRLLCRKLQVTGISTIYCTVPLGNQNQPEFYNGVVEAETDSSPYELKRDVLREIERMLGRQRTADKYAPRTIDIDILLYDDLVVDDDGLQIPDHDIATRPFLAIPLYELAPDLLLPGSGRPIRDIAESLSPDTMEPLPELTAQLRKEIIDGLSESCCTDPRVAD